MGAVSDSWPAGYKYRFRVTPYLKTKVHQALLPKEAEKKAQLGLTDDQVEGAWQKIFQASCARLEVDRIGLCIQKARSP